MFTKLTSKVMVALMMAAMVSLMVGCNNQEPRYPLANDTDRTVTRAVEEETHKDNLTENVKILTTSGATGWTSIDKVLGSPFVQPYLEEFGAQGYHFAPGYSFAVEAYVHSPDTTDSIAFSMVEVAMVNDSDTTRAAYIRYSKCELGHIITPYLLSFVPPDEPGFEYVTDGIWQKFLTGKVVPAFGKNREPMAASLDGYLDCVEAGTTAGCFVAIASCAYVGPSYPECVATGCALALVASVISCTFEELDGPPVCPDPGGSDPFCTEWWV